MYGPVTAWDPRSGPAAIWIILYRTARLLRPCANMLLRTFHSLKCFVSLTFMLFFSRKPAANFYFYFFTLRNQIRFFSASHCDTFSVPTVQYNSPHVKLEFPSTVAGKTIIWTPGGRIISEHRKGSHLRVYKAFQLRNLLKESNRYKD